MSQKNIFAFTPADASSHPPYVSLNERDGSLVLTMRGYSCGGSYASTDNIVISQADVQKMADGINAYLSRTIPAQGDAVPDGWQLVPKAITEDMHVAAVRAVVRANGNDDFPRAVWAGMLAAAPQPADAPRQSSADAVDAARYRWLRDYSGAEVAVRSFLGDPELIVELTNESIDAAIAAQGGKG